jgi:hypothetical protein
MKEAKSFDDVKIRPEHLVLSILLDEDNEGAQNAIWFKIDNNEFYDIVSDHLRKQL